MSINRNNKYIRLLATMLSYGAAFIVNYGISLVLTPYITNHVGIEACGFVSLAKQCAQYAVIITTALNSFASRYIAIEYHKGNIFEANQYFNSVFWGDVVLGTIILFIAAFAVFFLEKFLSIPETIIGDVKLLFLFVFLGFWVSTAFTAFSASAYVQNKLDITAVFRGLSYLTEALVMVICYTLFSTYVLYVGLGLFASNIVVGVSNLSISKKYTPDLTIKRGYFSFAAVKKLVLAGMWSSINSIGSMLNDGLDLIVSNLMLSALAMGQLSTAKVIYSIFSSLFYLVNQAFQPMFLKSYAAGDREKLMEELGISMRLSGMLANIGFAGFVSLGIVYFKLWIPDQDIETVYRLTIISILTMVAVSSVQPLYYIYTLTVKNILPCILTILGGVLNVLGMYILIRFTTLGVDAVVWTTVFVMSALSLVFNPLYMAHVLDKPWYTFYPNILRNLISCTALTIIFRTLSSLYIPQNWIQLILNAAVYVVIGVVIHLVITFRPSEYRDIVRVLKKR